MIYLVDDNENLEREKEYGVDFLNTDEFSSFLIPVRSLTPDTQFDFAADCFLIHVTTPDTDANGVIQKGKNGIVSRLIDRLLKAEPPIPTVLFSGGMPEKPEYNYEEDRDRIFQIKKRLFYLRLKPFLKFYREQQVIDLRIIAYGSNFKFINVSHFSLPLLERLRNYASDPVSPEIVGVELLNRFFSVAEIPGSFDEFIYRLSNNPPTKEQFIKNIQRINDSFVTYGKNIHGWL